MIIDGRIRPAVGGFLEMPIPFNPEAMEPFSKKLGLNFANSAKNKSISEMISEMKEAGIDMGVLVGRQSPGFGTGVGSKINDDIAALISKYPDRFVGIGGIHPMPTKNAIMEIKRCIEELKFVGVALEPGVAATPLYPNDRKMYPIYDFCQEIKIPIYLTVSGFVGPNIGFSDPAYVDQVAGDFPDLEIIVAHAAYPYVHPMLYSALLRPNINLILDLYVNMPGAQEFVTAANLFLQDKLIFASAYPIGSFDSIMESYKRLKLKDDVREKVMYKNIARLLKIDINKKGKVSKDRDKVVDGSYESGASPFMSIFERKQYD